MDLLLSITNSLMDRCQQFRLVGTHYLRDLLAILEYEEGRHGADGEFLCYVGDFVDVDFDEVYRGEFFGVSGEREG